MTFGKPQYASINARLNAKFAEKGTIIAAHRGSWRGNIIQNTLAAYRTAFLLGADMVETDTTATRDGVVYSLHDGVEPILLGLPRNATRLTSEVIDRYACLNALGAPTKQYVERLETVCAGLTHGELINVDRCWRGGGHVLEVLDRFPHMLEQAVLKAPLREKWVFEKLNGHDRKYMFMPICYTMKEVEEALSYPDLNVVGVELTAQTESDELFGREAVDALHARGLYAWVNTLVITDAEPDAALYAGLDDDISIKQDPALGWGRLMDMGVDVLQTDWPGLVREYREGRR